MKKKANHKTARTRTVKKSPNRSSKKPTRNKSLKGLRQKRFDTKEKRINHLKQDNNIITFKNEWVSRGRSQRQLLVTEFINKPGKYQLKGIWCDSLCYKTIDGLLDAIDWDWMDDNVIFKTDFY